MDDEMKERIRSLSNRISGVKTQLKKKPDDPEYTQRLADLTAERDALRGPIVERTTKPKAKKQNDLGVRRAMAARDARRSNLAVPTIPDLIKHAKRFGGEGVPEAAAEYGYGEAELTRLMKACDEADQARYTKAHPVRPKLKFGDVSKRVRAILGEDDD